VTKLTAPIDLGHWVPFLRKDFSFSRSAHQGFSDSQLCSAGAASNFSQCHSHSVSAAQIRPLGFLPKPGLHFVHRITPVPKTLARAHSVPVTWT
jgi:hypothetical protein